MYKDNPTTTAARKSARTRAKKPKAGRKKAGAETETSGNGPRHTFPRHLVVAALAFFLLVVCQQFNVPAGANAALLGSFRRQQGQQGRRVPLFGQTMFGAGTSPAPREAQSESDGVTAGRRRGLMMEPAPGELANPTRRPARRPNRRSTRDPSKRPTVE